MKKTLYKKALEAMAGKGNPEKAYSFLVEAVAEGDPEARYALGTWYLHGFFVKKNLRKAVLLLRLAADEDVADAAFDLAVCYEKGEGVKKNLSRAAAMYFRAMRCGDDSACAELYRMFYWGIGVSRNRLIANELKKIQVAD